MDSTTGIGSSWRRFEAVLLGLMLCTPLATDYVTGLVSFYKSYYIYLFAAFLLTAFLLRPWFRCGFRFSPAGVDIPLILFIAFAGISLYWSTNTPAHMQRFCLLLAALVGFYMIRVRIAEGDDPLKYLMLLTLVGGAVALIDSIAIILSHRQHLLLEVANKGQGAFKAESIVFMHNNVASLYVIGVVPLAFTALLCVKRLWSKLACLAVLGLILGYVVLLRSRAAWVEAPFIIALIGVGYTLRNRLKPLFNLSSRLLGIKLILVLLALLMLLACLAPMSADFSAWAKACFMEALHEFDLEFRRQHFRLDIWRKTMAMISDHFWVGVGLGNFPVDFLAYHKLRLPKSHPHSEYWNVFVELGAVGMFFYALFLLQLLRAFVQAMSRATERVHQLLLLGVGCALLVEALHGIVEPPMVFEASCLHLFVCSGLLVALNVRGNGDNAKKSDDAGSPTHEDRSRFMGGRLFPHDRLRGLRMLILPLAALLGLGWIVPALIPAFTQGVDIKRGGIALRNREYAKAEEIFRIVSTKGWDSHFTHTQIGDLCFWQGKYEEALAAYEKSEAMFPHNYEIHSKKGLVLRQLDRLEEAEQAIEKSLEYNHNNRYTQLELIKTQLQMGRFENAFRRLELYMHSKQPTIDDLVLAAKMYFRSFNEKTALSWNQRRDYLLKSLDYFERAEAAGGDTKASIERINALLGRPDEAESP